MQYSSSDMIFARIIRNGFIPQLGMCGPIPNPIKITRGLAHSLIVSGIKVYEYNPDTRDVTELTLQNVFGTSEEAVKKEEPKKSIPDPVKPVQLNGVKVEETPKQEKVEAKKEEKAPVKEKESKSETTQNTVKNDKKDNKSNKK